MNHNQTQHYITDFPNKKYEIIYADPGWSFNNKRTGGSMTSGSEAQYTVAGVDDICALPARDITADSCILFMWWVGSQPAEALRVVKTWGFTLKTMTGFAWVKKTKYGKDHFGMGFYTRAGTENCLIAIKGKPGVLSHSVRSVVYAETRKHSQKPDVIRDKIIELAGDKPRIELFAREQVDGWDSWGDSR